MLDEKMDESERRRGRGGMDTKQIPHKKEHCSRSWRVIVVSSCEEAQSALVERERSKEEKRERHSEGNRREDSLQCLKTHCTSQHFQCICVFL